MPAMTDDLHPELTTSLDAQDGRALLRAAGEVDLYTARDFAAALEAAVAASPHVLVDLTEVEFMDSTGLRALLEARGRATGAGGEVTLKVRPGSPIDRLLDLAGVSDLFGPPENRA
jgi:anti-sigma B factor antagonist